MISNISKKDSTAQPQSGAPPTVPQQCQEPLQPLQIQCQYQQQLQQQLPQQQQQQLQWQQQAGTPQQSVAPPTVPQQSQQSQQSLQSLQYLQYLQYLQLQLQLQQTQQYQQLQQTQQCPKIQLLLQWQIKKLKKLTQQQQLLQLQTWVQQIQKLTQQLLQSVEPRPERSKNEVNEKQVQNKEADPLTCHLIFIENTFKMMKKTKRKRVPVQKKTPLSFNTWKIVSLKKILSSPNNTNMESMKVEERPTTQQKPTEIEEKVNQKLDIEYIKYKLKITSQDKTKNKRKKAPQKKTNTQKK
jgi:hypothetical protein